MTPAVPSADSAREPAAPATAHPGYVGRFAPSPTGPLHFGSLLAATGSYLDAHAHHGRWLLRIEDVDTARALPDTMPSIRDALAAHALNADAELPLQSTRSDRYWAAAQALLASGAAFYCSCSRAQLAGQPTYPGHCRGQRTPPAGAWAIRVAVPPQTVTFTDRIQGEYAQALAAVVGDFVIWRKEGYASYQLAVVVDDADQGVTDVVRGADLLDNTPRQLWLQHQLGLPTPRYAHLPVITNAAGQKLSKQSFAQALDLSRPVANLAAALAALGQPLPQTLPASPALLLEWAVKHWTPAAIPRLARLSPAELPPVSRDLAG